MPRRAARFLRPPPTAVGRWAYGFAPVAVALLVRWLLDATLEDKSPFLLFAFAVMLAAAVGGVWVGATGTVVGAVAGLAFLSDGGQGVLEMFRSGRALQLMLYLVVCAGVTYLVDALVHVRGQAEKHAAEQRRLADELREADRAKDAFLAGLSHELRTPLTAIVGWAELLRGGRLSAADEEKAVTAIVRNARMQAQLVADMLDVARIASGKMRIDPRPVDAAEVVAAALETVAPSARARRIELRNESGKGAMVWADPDRLQQVVWNLLSNAVKFTPPGGRVRVRAEGAESGVRIVVQDSGPGLRPDFIPHLFERFRQDGETRSRGLGLGLAIVKHLVELHGGTVSARNRSDGPGALFEVHLPGWAARGERTTSPEQARERVMA